MNLEDRIVASASHAALSCKRVRQREDASIARIPEIIEWIKKEKDEAKIDFRIECLRIAVETRPLLYRNDAVFHVAEAILALRAPKKVPAPEKKPATPKTTVTRKPVFKKKATRKKTVG